MTQLSSHALRQERKEALRERAAFRRSRAIRFAAERRFCLALLVALVAVIVLHGVAYQDAVAEAESQRRLSVEYRRQEQVRGLLTAMSECEAARLAYLFAPHPERRRRFERIRAQVDQQLDLLGRSGPLATPETMAQRRQLAVLSRRYFAAIDLKGGAEPATIRAISGRMRDLLQEIRRHGARLLERRELEVEQELARERALVLVRAVGMVALLGGGLFAFRQERRRVSERERLLCEANARLELLAQEDSLTALKNRRALEEQLERDWKRAWRYQHPLSLMLLDVDHFKRYNDRHGHLAGDEVLKEVAHALRETARGGDFVARFGGEEFIVLMPCTGAAGGVALAGRLQEALTRRNWPFEPVTVSVGVATLHLAMGTVDDLIQAADDALYAAKREGRNRVVQAMDLQDSSPIRPLPDPSR